MKTPRRRRLEAKTDYKARLALLKSGRPRLVVRKSNRYIIAQIVESDIAQDKVIAGANSKVLLSRGWPKEMAGSLKSLSAAYLTGFILGKIAQEKKVKEAILDMGMYRTVKGSRIYAVLKGAVDAGIKIPHNAEMLPSEEKIKNEKTEKILNKIMGGK
jgi:large subunit ribosomal protein L18